MKRKILSVLFALLVISVGLVADTPAVAQEDLLSVDITAPLATDIYHVSQTFNVTAEVTNISDHNLDSVVVTLGWLAQGDADLVGGDLSYDVGPISRNSTQEVNWTLHCAGAGTLVINVIAETETVSHEATVTVQQLEVEALTVTITAPLPDAEIGFTTEFDVTAIIANTGWATINHIIPTIDWVGETVPDAGASLVSGPDFTDFSLARGDSQVVTWTLHCDAAYNWAEEQAATHGYLVDITVDAAGIGAKTGGTIEAEEDMVTIEQKYLIVVIKDGANPLAPYAFHCMDVNIGQEFFVFAEVFNYHDETVTNVTATLTWVAPGDLSLSSPPGPTAIQTLGNIPGDGGSVTLPIDWHVRCEGVGDVDISVTAQGSTTPSLVTLHNDDTIQVHQMLKAHLTPTIEAPDDDTWFNVGDEFTVTAEIENTGDATASDVNADLVITGPGSASVVSGPAPTGFTLLGGDHQDVTWTLECTGLGDVTITVTPSGIDANTTVAIIEANLDDDAITVHQMDLVVVITAPANLKTYSVSQVFTVDANITNNDVVPITVDKAVISFIGSADIVSGEAYTKTLPVGSKVIYPGQTQQVSWTVHCEAPGDAIITVTADVTHHDLVPLDPVVLKWDTITVEQEAPTDLVVEILSPGNAAITLGSSGIGEGLNYGIAEWSTTEKHSGLDSVYLEVGDNDEYAELYFPVNILLGDIDLTTTSFWAYATGGDFIPYLMFEILGDFPNDGVRLFICNDADASADYALRWGEFVASDAVGLTPWQWDILDINWNSVGGGPAFDTWDNLVALYGDRTVSCVLVENSAVIGTYPVSAYIDDITINGALYPVEYITDTYIGTSTDFAVTARVRNIGGADSLNTTVTLTTDPAAQASVKLPEVPEIPLGTLASGASQIVTWTVHCDESGTTTINVSAMGADENSSDLKFADNFVLIEQYAKAHLEVEITQFPPAPIDVSSTFTVIAEITNTGEADAWEVSATLSVFPELSAKVTDGGYTQTVGTLVGHGVDGSAIVEWELHCKVASESTITITAAGYDEFGWHLKQDPQTGETILVSMPGRAIPENNIEPASVTVKQEEAPLPPTDADLGIEKVADSETVTMRDTVTFTVTVTNNGPAGATGVTVADVLPTGLNYESSSTVTGWYDVTSGVWSVGDLADAATATLTITATVNAVGEICNVASVTADQPDPTTSNNSDLVCITGAEEDPDNCVDLTGGVAPLGFNLISLPRIPQSDNITEWLAAVSDNVSVVAYFTGGPTGVWVYYWPGEPEFSDFTTIEDGKGYFIQTNETATICYDGYEISAPPPAVPPYYDMVMGWNLFGFKSTVPKLPADYLAAIDGSFTVVYGYANGTYFIVGSPGHEYLQPALGYWIAMTIAGTIYP